MSGPSDRVGAVRNAAAAEQAEADRAWKNGDALQGFVAAVALLVGLSVWLFVLASVVVFLADVPPAEGVAYGLTGLVLFGLAWLVGCRVYDNAVAARRRRRVLTGIATQRVTTRP